MCSGRWFSWSLLLPQPLEAHPPAAGAVWLCPKTVSSMHVLRNEKGFVWVLERLFQVACQAGNISIYYLFFNYMEFFVGWATKELEGECRECDVGKMTDKMCLISLC